MSDRKSVLGAIAGVVAPSIASFVIVAGSIVPVAIAHTVKAGDDIAALFHLEPDHNPRSGEPAQVWFALTRRGGAALPLGECDCRLAIYARPGSSRSESATNADSKGNAKAGSPEPSVGQSIGQPIALPIAEPSLRPIAAETHQDSPGATVIFPAPGAYDLILRGKPKVAGGFKPFELRFEVLATQGAAGSGSPTPTTPSVQPAAKPDQAKPEPTVNTPQGDRVNPLNRSSNQSNGINGIDRRWFGAGIAIFGLGITGLGSWFWWRSNHRHDEE